MLEEDYEIRKRRSIAFISQFIGKQKLRSEAQTRQRKTRNHFHRQFAWVGQHI